MSGKIRNPATGREVLRKSPVGKALVACEEMYKTKREMEMMAPALSFGKVYPAAMAPSPFMMNNPLRRRSRSMVKIRAASRKAPSKLKRTLRAYRAF